MNTLQVRVRTPLTIAATSLYDLIALPDPKAAEQLDLRMRMLNEVERIHQVSFVERGIIAREFERRKLWQHLIDPDTGQCFPNLTGWLSCSDFLGCRRVNFEAKRDMEMLEDVPAEKLIDVPKSSIKTLIQLSTAVRNDDAVLQAARTMKPDEFLEKIETEHPQQLIETRKPMRFSPGRSGAKVVEKAIAWALEHGLANTRDEAFVRMAEQALNEWELEDELAHMPADELKTTEEV